MYLNELVPADKRYT